MKYIEDEHIELKRIFNDTIVKEIVAFLNTDGGKVYIGVEDNGEVCGVEKLDETLKKLSDIVEYQILPDCRDLVELGTRYEGGKHVVEITVRHGSDLYYIKKYGRSAQGCFMRVGTTCRSMTEEQIERTHTRYLASKVSITEIASRMKTFSFQFLKMMMMEKGMSVNESTFEENLHLRTSFGDYNKMAELLADKNETSIKVVRFRGKSKADEIIRRNEYGDKCLLVAMRQAYDYCADVINSTRTRMVRDERKEQRLFDNEAFREAWYNACLHNNWADGTPPAIYIFNDRLEIISTGGLQTNLSKEDFYKGVSKPVNEELARLFIRLDLMEQTGHGVPLVVKRYGKKVFDFMDFFIKVSIPFEYELTDEDEAGDTSDGTSDVTSVTSDDTSNGGIGGSDVTSDVISVTSDDTSNGGIGGSDVTSDITNVVSDVGSLSVVQLSERQKKICDMITEDPYISSSQMSVVLSVAKRTIKRELANMQKQGILKREGNTSAGHWVILNYYSTNYPNPKV